jgi:DNA mismatch repair protein MutH
LIEQALGVANTGLELKSQVTDFPELGIELKTLPVDVHGRPRESTFVCHVDLKVIADCEWKQSRACEKLAHVLFVPIESDRNVSFAERRIGAAFLWMPSDEEHALLRADYDEIAGRVGIGDIESLTGHVGRVLQVRPKAPNARTRTRAADGDGASQATFPRAFYLRPSFTEQILARALGISSRDRTVF